MRSSRSSPAASLSHFKITIFCSYFKAVNFQWDNGREMLCRAHIATPTAETTNPGRAQISLQRILNSSSQHPSELGITAPGSQLRMLRLAKWFLELSCSACCWAVVRPRAWTPDPVLFLVFFFFFFPHKEALIWGLTWNHTNKMCINTNPYWAMTQIAKGKVKTKQTHWWLYTVGHSCVLYTRKSFTK